MIISKPIISDLPIVTSLNVNSYKVSGSGVANGTIYLTFRDLKNHVISFTLNINSKGNFTKSVNLTGLNDGQVVLEAYQQDKKGNVSAKIIKSILKDTMGPSIVFQEINITAANQAEYPVTGTVEANTTVSLTVSDGNQQTATKNARADINGNFFGTFDLRQLNDGEIVITGAAKDSYGNSLTSTITVVKNTGQVPPPNGDGKVYELNTAERTKWKVYNDGTHPLETTNGFNNSLKWAQGQGFTTFSVPAGNYLISMDNPISLISNMRLILDNDTVFQKETNGYQEYSVFFLGDIENIEIKGGKFVGDRDTHNYSESGTHEWGHAFLIRGASNVVIDSVKMEKFTGDGIEIQGGTVKGDEISEKNLEFGSLDTNGNPISFQGKIRSKNIYLTDSVYRIYKNIYMWLPNGITGDQFDIFYYRKDGSFIKSDKNLKFFVGESIIPDDANYFRAVFDASTTKNVSVTYMTIDLPENITVKNCEISNNRRQGISVVGAKGVTIESNNIHDMKGTAPESGIDVEPGFYPANDIFIRNNRFANNELHVILTYGGKNAVVENNYFGPSRSLGVSAQDFGDVVISNNEFVQSSLGAESDNVVAKNNKFTDSSVLIDGKGGVFSSAVLIDSSLSVGASVNQKIDDIQIYQNSKFAEQAALYIWDKPVQMRDITIYGSNTGRQNSYLLIGGGSNESIYENLKIFDTATRGTVLPAGTYSNPTLEAGEIVINRAGKYIFNNASIKSPNNLLMIEATYGGPDISFNNSTFTLTANIGYGAAIYVTGATAFNILNSTINAVNSKNTTPLIKLGLYGSPVPTQVFSANFKGNTISTLKGVNLAAIDTSNAGIGAPPFRIENNIIYNGILSLKANDISLNNKLLVR
ncbi:right-handed parallel beta-helix repeat-containing protein [Bacillus salipaludis]|uniref:Right-handed parallel beta-helix repeat-containing protein n=1 Tax=Bacillus salipaludis TaxID=2547811 RepID=A0ABW8R9J0_9BACI